MEEIGARLAGQGVRVIVYCRTHKSAIDARSYRGMERVVLPSVPTQNLDTVTHSFLATIDLLVRDRADVIHFHGMGNGLFLPLVKLSRKKAVITIDGPDWERPKWGRVARKALRLGARLSVRMADHLIIDNHPSIEYFRREMGAPDDRLTYIPYGADFERPTDTDQLAAFGVVPRGYLPARRRAASRQGRGCADRRVRADERRDAAPGRRRFALRARNSASMSTLRRLAIHA